MESLEQLIYSPVGTILGIGSGWAIVCALVMMLFRGDIITKREARAMERRIEALTKALETRDEQVNLLLKETVPTINTFLDDIRIAAEVARRERSTGEGPK